MVSAAFRFYKNGELQKESPCDLELYEDANGKTLDCWDAAEGHETSCKTCDKLETHFFCTDKYGIQYEFPVKSWEITDVDATVLWPQTMLPTVIWPE
ncbi:hypothetical protein OBV_24640 [Oscillibacter valericigenes Sjm18-20]|nr:hypothetical protein OBV_24640 [Oscillibacter valericigenes Sjm18-20]